MLAALCLALATGCTQKTGGETFIVSVDNAGNAGDGGSGKSVISADGRFVVFWSWAPNVTSDDRGLLAPYVVLRDRSRGETNIVSPSDTVSSTGGNVTAISSGGRYVAFVSADSGIVSGDTNEAYDVFVKDLDTSGVVRASVDSAGNQGDAGSVQPAISADGRFVAFASGGENFVPGGIAGIDVFVHDFDMGDTDRVSADSSGNPGNDASWDPSISGDGRYVAFMSSATNLVDSDTNDSCDLDGDKFADDNCIDVFVHDLQRVKPR